MSANVVDLGTEPLLEPAEAYALAGQVEAGVLARAARLDPTLPWRGDASSAELVLLEEQGERARQRFIAANLRLVGLVVRSFGGRGRGSADLYQEGCLGLISAVARFDHRRGTRFSTYALFWVRAAVGAAAARAVGSAQLPTSRAEQLRAARGHEAELAQTLGRSPSVAELADSLGRTRAWTAALLAARPPQPAGRDRPGGAGPGGRAAPASGRRGPRLGARAPGRPGRGGAAGARAAARLRRTRPVLTGGGGSTAAATGQPGPASRAAGAGAAA